MEKKETPQRNLRRFFVVGREPEKVTFRFAERYASFNFSGTFRFADYSAVPVFFSPSQKKTMSVYFNFTIINWTFSFNVRIGSN